MKTGKDVQVGDEVIVVRPMGHRKQHYRAKVVKAARAWLELEEIIGVGASRTYPLTWRMHRQSQATQLHSERWGVHFLTLEQHEERERIAKTARILHKHGIDIKPSSPWHYRRAELAAALEILAAELDKVEDGTQA